MHIGVGTVAATLSDRGEHLTVLVRPEQQYVAVFERRVAATSPAEDGAGSRQVSQT
jgi:hypothetical protein